MAREASPFEQLVLPHLDAAANLARWLMRDAAAADDVVQEAMLRALRFHAGLQGDAKPWLLQIVRNTAYAAMAARQKRAEVPIDAPIGHPGGHPAEPACAEDDPEAALAAREEQAQLERALAALPADLRECLVLRELEAMTYRQIAQIVGAPIGTVMSRLWRARQRLLEGAP